MSDHPKYSIILPICNEESCLGDTLQRIIGVMASMNAFYEVICVDDFSDDSSWSIVAHLHDRYPQIKGLRFQRNFGQQLAIYAGIKKCSGEFVAVMDADGQDPPEFLPQLFTKCQEGYDVVYGVRQKRKEVLWKRMAYKNFYRIYQKLVPFNVPVNSGDFAVFTKRVALFIQALGEKRPFIRGLRSWYGGKQCGLEFERPERTAGKPKYSLVKLILLGVNGAVSFSKLPLRIISLVGMSIAFLSFLGGLYLLFLKFTIGIDLLGWTSTALLIIFFGGINIFVLGIFGEYLGDIYDEVKNRPPFLISSTIGLE